MTGLNRKLLWAGLAVAVALGLIWQLFPLPDAQARVRALPQSGILYAGQDLPIPPEMRMVFGKAQVLKRGYQVGGQRVIVWVIDGSRNRHAVHDPLYCIRGGGWRIVSQNPFPIRGGSAKLILAEKDGAQAESLVWFSDGNTRHASALRYWGQTTLRRLTLGWSGPEPVLITVQLAGSEVVNWRQLAGQFAPLFEL
jgi:hypothetical protein